MASPTAHKAVSIGEPPGRDLETEQGQIAGSQDRRDDTRRDALLPYPPEQVKAVHHAFDAGDVIRQVERDAATKGSIRRHELSPSLRA